MLHRNVYQETNTIFEERIPTLGEYDNLIETLNRAYLRFPVVLSFTNIMTGPIKATLKDLSH